MSLSKNINPSLVLDQPRKTRPFITERLLMGRKESNQINKNIKNRFFNYDGNSNFYEYTTQHTFSLELKENKQSLHVHFVNFTKSFSDFVDKRLKGLKGANEIFHIHQF